jgi:DNA-binding response OmpR family regulator
MRETDSKIFIIDDKHEIKIDGYDTTTVSSLNDVEKKILEDDVSLVIIQRELNGIDGADVVKKLKTNGIQVPMVLISSKVSNDEVIYGFDVGCDDYITKPFVQPILDARVNSIISRTKKVSNSFQVSNISYDGKSNSFTIEKEKIDLTKLEKKLLLEFMKNNNKILTRKYIVEKVWDNKIKESTISVVIKRLKEKIDPNNKRDMIRPIYGKGYLFVV